MDDEQLLRYSRQIMLPQVGIEGQIKLSQARVLIIGLGGLGSPVAMYLAAAGIGNLVLVDHDQVDLTNLQRQIIHTTHSIGKDKTQSAKVTLEQLNPEVTATLFNRKLDEQTLAEQISLATVVVDASDNFPTRFLLNQICARQNRPLVSGAVIRTEGQVSVFDHSNPDSPCYRCLYQDSEQPQETCSETGILAPVAGIIGTIQATEAMKVILGLGETLVGRLLILDALAMEWRTIKLKKDASC
ncbi:MAG: molybdopterin-synthase adenylyltransferase MoeB, partial [Gammaproteobacteria bacterium]|nr:molybdopterin-synthase adenylyltransferase MoeB [Gammaproteobacteria bacterium]